MAQNDLVSLYAVQDWLAAGNQSPSNSDQVLSRLIRTCSASIMSYLQRSSFLSQQFTDVVDGLGQKLVFLNEWPVTSIDAVSVDGIPVLESINSAPGWLLTEWNGYPPGSPQWIEMIYGAFGRGQQNVSVTYTAGYLVEDEAWTIPATPYQVTAAQDQGTWSRDEGVVCASSGVALVRVAAAPAVGQYALIAQSSTVGAGMYQFAAADVGRGVLGNYSYVPSSIEDAAMNWVAERYRYRGRIGQRSQSTGGQTSNSYDLSDIPKYLTTQLQPFKKVLPV